MFLILFVSSLLALDSCSKPSGGLSDGGARRPDAGSHQEATSETKEESTETLERERRPERESSPMVREEVEPQVESKAESGPESAVERSSDSSPAQCPPSPVEPLQKVQSWKNLSVNKGLSSETLPACSSQGFRIVGAKGAEYEVHIKGFSSAVDLRLTVYNARRANQVSAEKPKVQVSSKGQGWLVAKFAVKQSGEISLVTDILRHNRSVTYQVEVFCNKNCQREATRFPIVLIHGFAGTDKYFGILTYFYKVKAHLEQSGYSVFTPTVQPIANSTTRVKTLKQKIDEILKKTGARRLNLIGHSQGGIDGRLLLSIYKYGDRVASLTTVSSPHRGLPIPNLLLPPSQELSESNMKKYNQTYPNEKQVKYFSWAGLSCRWLDSSCRKKNNNEVIDPLLITTYNTLKALRGDNDGIVPVSSAKWGTFLGTLPADHFDEIGQIADRNNSSFDHKAFYLKEARRLRGIGF